MFDVDYLHDLDLFQVSEHFQSKEEIFKFVQQVEATRNYLYNKQLKLLNEEVIQYQKACSVIGKLSKSLSTPSNLKRLALSDDELIRYSKMSVHAIDDRTRILFKFVFMGGRIPEVSI